MSLQVQRPGAQEVDRRSSWRRTEDVLGARVVAIELSLAEVLPTGATQQARNRLMAGDLSGAVEALTWQCVSAATADPDVSDDQRQVLQEALATMQQLGQLTFQHELGLLSHRLADCDAAVGRLRTLASSNDLLDQVCGELVVACGFGRAVLSRVDGAMWKPWMAHFSSGTDTDEKWFKDWVDRPIPLEGADVESRILAERRPEAVYDTETADVHRPIIVDAGHSSSYVVAPLIVDDVVIGFLHADYRSTGRRVDAVDRDVLWAFAQGFAQLYERAVLRERLMEQRERVRQVLAASDDLLADRSCELAVDSGHAPAMPGAALKSAPSFGPGDALEQLTERERDVLALVAVGATNQQIAEQLVVAESTVKTHVKHILRKLGVTNRAQAISQFLHGSTPAPP